MTFDKDKEQQRLLEVQAIREKHIGNKKDTA
jgi:hypothetical protein